MVENFLKNPVLISSHVSGLLSTGRSGSYIEQLKKKLIFLPNGSLYTPGS